MARNASKEAGFRVATATSAAGLRCDDHVSVARREDGLVLALADGAGNSDDGGPLAEWLVSTIKERALEAKNLPGADALSRWIEALDMQWFATGRRGESALVVVSVTHSKVSGASVGDCGAWLVRSGRYQELNGEQRRKPLVGQGRATVLPFGPLPMQGVLLLATDGLLKYAPETKIQHLATDGNVSVAAAKLVDLVRTASGALQDDVGLIVCRKED
ncbi:MAG: protein phosphatase 2C domain-containing protein [Deltaproteobacteria bacterium]|nr:protein phosphatase 2C domain-containing protein [Deltaproteobacteria bacterium]